MGNRLNEHKNRLIDIVNDAIRSTFKIYFDIDVDVEKLHAASSLRDSVTCKTCIHDGDLQGSVYISIEKTMLTELALKAYAPLTQLDDEKIMSCALEIANIVCARVKTYLNEKGYNFGMDTPYVIPNNEKIDDDLEMVFSIREKSLIVDIGLNDKKGFRLKQPRFSDEKRFSPYHACQTR